MNLLWLIPLCAAIALLTFLILYFTLVLVEPKKRPVASDEPVDVVVVGENATATEENARRFVPFARSVFAIDKESDLFALYERLSPFFLVLRSNMLFTREVSRDDFFFSDSVPFVISQKNVVQDESEYDRHVLRSRGLRFKLAELQPVCCSPVLVDRDLFAGLADLADQPPSQLVFYVYTNYALITGRSRLNTDASFAHVQGSYSKTQRPWLYVEPELVDQTAKGL